MPDSDRLAELRRQRALIQEHLAWLDSQIETASGTKPPAPATPPSPQSPPLVEDPALAAAIVAAALKAKGSPAAPEPSPADAILDEYKVAPDLLKTDVRKGCFLYFAAAFALLIVAVVILYFALSRD